MAASILLLLLVVGLGVASIVLRRAELARMAQSVTRRRHARATGTHRARLQYPQVDLSRCIGCGTCVRACPEEGVLELIHGQAVVAHGARCVGHGRCAAECPVGAIAISFADLAQRRDLPALTDRFESTRVRGLFLAGEVTGYALIRTAIAHGTAVADEVASRIASDARAGRTRGRDELLDLVIVGAGPAGLACSLQAKARALSFVTLEQSDLGGTVSKYPRRKLVMTQPITLPLHGRLDQTTYAKEELMKLWTAVSKRHDLPIRTDEEFTGVEALADGTLTVRTKRGSYRARNVCLALGRRGTPRRLGVPGEELPKVAYSLLDAQSYRGRRILVVGGGDSAVEAALGLADQPGNQVTLSYRRAQFSRLRARNEARLHEAVQAGHVELLLESEVASIERDRVILTLTGGVQRALANDEVFVFAGGVAPQELLEAAGVSFDPNERPAAAPLAERGTGLRPALAAALVLAVATYAWTRIYAGYYSLPVHERPHAPQHDWLRPSGSFGLACGIAAAVLVVANLTYLLRRSVRVARLPGSLQAWMTAHVMTGIGALLFAILHSALDPRHTVGGHAFAALVFLVATGAIGRYLYAFVPRAANGRELALEDVRGSLAALASEWDRGNRGFSERVRAEVEGLMADGHWQGSFLARLYALARQQRRLAASLARLRAEGRAEGVPPEQVRALLSLARRAQRAALMAAHYEDVRALLASWRYFHRWVALALVLLIAYHVATALRYGSFG